MAVNRSGSATTKSAIMLSGRQAIDWRKPLADRLHFFIWEMTNCPENVLEWPQDMLINQKQYNLIIVVHLIPINIIFSFF